MKQDHYGGNWYEDPPPPHQKTRTNWSLLGIIALTTLFWVLATWGTIKLYQYWH